MKVELSTREIGHIVTLLERSAEEIRSDINRARSGKKDPLWIAGRRMALAAVNNLTRRMIDAKEAELTDRAVQRMREHLQLKDGEVLSSTE